MTSDPVAVVERARAAIARYDRPDLDERLAAAHARLLDDRTRVLVVGEFKQGKSLLVNGLVGAPVCPTFDDVATAVPTVVRHAEALDIALVRPDGERTTITGDELADHVCEQGNPGNREGWSHAEIGLPRPVLERRAGDRRHPRCRRAGVGARRGDDGRAAVRRRRAARLRRRPGVHRAGAGVPRPGDRGLPERGLRDHEDRPVPRVAAHRRARPRATSPRPGSPRRSSRCRRRCAGTPSCTATPRSTPSPASRS